MIKTIIHRWDDKHGKCAECGDPATFLVLDAYGPRKHMKVDSVCAANAAAEGSKIARIEPFD